MARKRFSCPIYLIPLLNLYTCCRINGLKIMYPRASWQYSTVLGGTYDKGSHTFLLARALVLPSATPRFGSSISSSFPCRTQEKKQKHQRKARKKKKNGNFVTVSFWSDASEVMWCRGNTTSWLYLDDAIEWYNVRDVICWPGCQIRNLWVNSFCQIMNTIDVKSRELYTTVREMYRLAWWW